jgi:hypothetical protein
MENGSEVESGGWVLPNPYPIPLYLNQKYVFSLLATLEGGYAELENVKANRTVEHQQSSNISGEVGVTNAFAFLGIKLGGQRGTEHKSGDTQEITSERVHTPDSLFARLREQLHQEGMIRTESLDEAVPGEYVEFMAVLSKNPIVEALETVQDFFHMLEENDTATTPVQPKPNNKTQNRRQAQPRTSGVTASNTQNTTAYKQLNIMLNSVRGKEGTTFYLVGEIVGTQIQSVVVMDPNFANDPIAADLIDGQYTVLGKVVRAIPQESQEVINLLRNASIGKLAIFTNQIAEAVQGMNELGVDLPDVRKTTVSGPAIQVVPIAIFM